MKYLGEENEVQIKTVRRRYVEYIRCDRCKKKITPCKFNEKQNQYIHIHTWHSDWGNDSIDSHNRADYCVECAKIKVAEYIEKSNGTEELEMSNEYLGTRESYDGYNGSYEDWDYGFSLVEKDNV